MTRIIISNSKEPCLIDDEDVKAVTAFSWRLDDSPNGASCVRRSTTVNNRQVKISLAEFIMGGGKIDHKDRNPLNNQKSNLRRCTNGQNAINKPKQVGTTSKYKGVHWSSGNGRWKAQLGVNGERLYLGLFRDERSAAEAYNKAASLYFGEFAVLNVI